MTQMREPRETILVVDDNMGVRGYTKLSLEDAGFDVITAADGEEALRLYQQHQLSIVLLITDVGMPNMNGFQLADRVLQIDTQLPVLFMSGRYAGIVFRGLECIAKPFQPAELVEKVKWALNMPCSKYEHTLEKSGLQNTALAEPY